jgi:hypothetical protein
MTKPTKLTNEQMRPGQEVEQHLREYGHLPDTGCCGLETNFIEEQQREALNTFEYYYDRKMIDEEINEINSVISQTITNTLNHILESGLLEEKPVSKVEFLPEDGHNELARAVKEFMSNM